MRRRTWTLKIRRAEVGRTSPQGELTVAQLNQRLFEGERSRRKEGRKVFLHEMKNANKYRPETCSRNV